MRVLVCGGRYFQNRDFVFKYLDDVHENLGITSIVHGGAPGADTLAGKWAESRKITCIVEPAQWRKYGKRAGSVRNLHMFNTYHPDMIIAFPGYRGTSHMKKIGYDNGIPVVEASPSPRARK